jgi:hypothetical protein
MKLDLNALDPLPALGAKLQTEVVYYHSEEKEVAPYLYEKDGKLRYAPPVLADPRQQFMDDICAKLVEAIENDLLNNLLAGTPQTALLLHAAVEEEKQDNKPAYGVDIALPENFFCTRVGERWFMTDAEGWISHTPGDPMPCAPYQAVWVEQRNGDVWDHCNGNPWRAHEFDWGELKPTEGGCQVIRWKPA